MIDEPEPTCPNCGQAMDPQAVAEYAELLADLEQLRRVVSRET